MNAISTGTPAALIPPTGTGTPVTPPILVPADGPALPAPAVPVPPPVPPPPFTAATGTPLTGTGTTARLRTVPVTPRAAASITASHRHLGPPRGHRSATSDASVDGPVCAQWTCPHTPPVGEVA